MRLPLPRAAPTLAVAGALVLLLAGARPAGAQAAPRPALDTVAGVPVQGLAAILVAETLLETERGGDAAAAARSTRLADVAARGYRTLASDPALTGAALSRAVLGFYAQRGAASSPAETSVRAAEQTLRLMLLQAAQNARLIEQNDRILRLLEAEAARK